MTDVKVRKLDPWIVEVHRVRAQQAGHSLEEEMRRVITTAAREARLRFAGEAADLRDAIRREVGELPDSTDLIREEREARG